MFIGLLTTKMQGEIVLVKILEQIMGQWYAELSYSISWKLQHQLKAHTI